MNIVKLEKKKNIFHKYLKIRSTPRTMNTPPKITKNNKYLGQMLVLLLKNEGSLTIDYQTLKQHLCVPKKSWKLWSRFNFDLFILVEIQKQLKEVDYDFTFKRNENNDYFLQLFHPKIIIREVFKPLLEIDKKELNENAKRDHKNFIMKRHILDCLIRKYKKEKEFKKLEAKKQELKKLDKENFYNPNQQRQKLIKSPKPTNIK